jgi:hypothetical protein
MSDFLNTENKTIQYNGPVNSSDFNIRAEQNFEDLVHLYNRSGVLDQKLSQAFERVLKDHLFISRAIADIEDRLKAVEFDTSSTYKKLSIYNYSQIDVASFIGNNQFAVSSTEVLSFDHVYNIITLPKIEGSSYSKLKFFSGIGEQIIPDFLETKLKNSFVSLDVSGALVDTTPMFHALLDRSDKFWKRNIIANSPSAAGAQMLAYYKVPNAYSGSDTSNFLSLSPYPLFGVDIIAIEYTTTLDPQMEESDGWTPLNFNRLYDSESDAIGRVPPGGWSTLGADAILNSGPIGFYFPPIKITAIRINMRQRNYILENGKYIYTYGLSDLDIRSQRFLESGRTIVKFTAPTGSLIYSIDEVIPKMYNVPEELISTAFSYRIIYKDSGVYTLDEVPGSSSVWIEITLNQLSDGTAPVLSDLIVNYS